MNRALTAATCLIASAFSAQCVYADQRDDAIAEANTVITLLTQGKYQQIWDEQAGEVMKSMMKDNEDYFLSHMSLGRAGLPQLSSSNEINVDYANYDPASKFTGDIYAVTFLDVYGAVRLYERVVVYSDNGVFKLGGLFAAPAPTSPQ